MVFDYPDANADDADRGKSFREVFPTFEDDMEELYGERDERTGRYGRWFNPNSQYDWYQFGGRFTGHLVLKPGREGRLGSPGICTAPAGAGRAGQAKKGDIDFAAMSREWYASFLRAWSELERTGKTSVQLAKLWHDIPETVTTREQFLEFAGKRSAHNAPTGFVVNGEWSGPWWLKDGVTEEAATRWDARYAALLASLPDNTLLTVIDCHMVLTIRPGEPPAHPGRPPGRKRPAPNAETAAGLLRLAPPRRERPGLRPDEDGNGDASRPRNPRRPAPTTQL